MGLWDLWLVQGGLTQGQGLGIAQGEEGNREDLVTEHTRKGEREVWGWTAPPGKQASEPHDGIFASQ